MKKEKNELMMFLAGILMLVVGLFILSKKIMVYTSWLSFGGYHISGGMIFIPLIAGIIWLFATNSFGSKVLIVLSTIFIIVSIILSVNIHMVSMSMFDWIVILVLIFGGLGFVARVLFAEKHGNSNKKGIAEEGKGNNSKGTPENDELERLKKQMNQ